MPYVNLQIVAGTSREQRLAIVREFTDTLVRVLGKKPEHTHIVIEEVPEENWGFAGMLTDEWRKLERSSGCALSITRPGPARSPPTSSFRRSALRSKRSG